MGRMLRTQMNVAIQATDNFLKAFNAKDAVEWAATLNYPHIRFSNGSVTTWDSEEEYAEMAKSRFITLVSKRLELQSLVEA